MTTKRIVAFLLAALFALGCLSACGTTAPAETPNGGTASDAAQGSPVRFVINTASASRSNAVQMLVDRLSELSDGRITGQIVESGALGNERELAEAVQMGSVDIALIANPQIANVINDLKWQSLPGLFYNYDEVVDTVFNGWIGEYMAEVMAQNNIILLAFLDNGFRSTGSTKKALDTPDAYKGLTVRTASNEPHVLFYQQLGALPMTIDESEVATSVQQGVVDAVDNNVYNYAGQGVDQLIKYVTDVPLYTSASIVCSSSFWSTLTPEDQALFSAAAKEVEEWYLTYYRGLLDELKEKKVSAGEWEITEVSDELQAAFAEASDAVWEHYLTSDPAHYEDIIGRLREWRAGLDG